MKLGIKPKGKVIIAGAGPGDPELITLKAFRYLQQADVVIVDRLVSAELLRCCRLDAVIIFAGKQGRNSGSTPQNKINSMMVSSSMEYNLVVRLKGGDVSIFSNLLDELRTLREHNISFEVVPGVTAASGAAACAGIPLTARDHATAVRFITCYNDALLESMNWTELAATDDTLVFYMSASMIDAIVEKLLDSKISSSKHLAIIQQATTPQQRVDIYNLYEYSFSRDHGQTMSPSIIIVGSVAKLHQDFNWMQGTNSNEYFRPLEIIRNDAVTNIAN